MHRNCSFHLSANFNAFSQKTDLPGARIESPSENPMTSLIFLRTKLSIRMNTGAISYVNMLVFAVAVSHSPAMETVSSPQDNWLKKWGWPFDIDKPQKYLENLQLFQFPTTMTIDNLFSLLPTISTVQNLNGAHKMHWKILCSARKLIKRLTKLQY